MQKINYNIIRSISTLKNNLNTKIQPAASNIDHEISIKKLKLNDKNLSDLLLTIKSKKIKQSNQKIIVEGNVLIKEAIKAHLKPDKFVFSDLRKFNEFYKEITKFIGPKAVKSIENLKVPQTDLTFYSTLTTCPGIMAIFDKPHKIPEKTNALPITVISDGCKEPNNVGALIRVSNSLPIKEMLLPKGNVDVWDTKSIRGSSGSIFYLPTESQLTWDEIDQRISPHDLVFVADSNTNKYSKDLVLDYDSIPNDLLTANSHFCVIVGGETQGISKEALNFAKNRTWKVINIPIDPTANSLNISNALAIILFELRRKLSLVMS